MDKLLLIDDDKEVLAVNTKYFKGLGYEVDYAINAKTALKKLESYKPDCIVMDVMMPGIDGFEAIRHIKKISDAPVIFLTGRDSEDDKIKGLLLGGDDYIIKPYSLRELEVRIKVAIRRYQGTTLSAKESSSILAFPLLIIDTAKHKIYYKGNSGEEEIRISNKEYDFLYLLATTPDKVFTFKEIGNAVWGGYIDSDRKTIMVTASRLRKKLEIYPGLSNYIETVWSQGYKFGSR